MKSTKLVVSSLLLAIAVAVIGPMPQPPDVRANVTSTSSLSK